MADVNDVAAYVLQQQGRLTTWKLQKLIYYCQAWHLVWDEQPLFPQRIEAWANGPVVRELYDRHRGLFDVTTWDGSADILSQSERETVDAVLGYYGDRTGHWLSQLTHSEPPWRDARVGMAEGERGNVEITTGAMAEYYGSLT